MKAVFTSPRPSITTKTFSIKNLLSRHHKFVARVHARVGGIAVASQLHSLHLCDLFGQWFFGREYLVDVSVSRIRNVSQPTSQIVNRISGRIKRSCLSLVFFGEIKVKLLAFLVSGYEVVRRVALVMCGNQHPLVP
ncbi:hypothetical protein [Mycobacterium scrofulaceum]|uniref:hypothetical protein n=1 Tax=Mycobacterium scrofulaceum TaxID=1783 RepID=UPI0012EA8096|nr:hypothetical protein [Mycobacterium scrofulaceum]